MTSRKTDEGVRMGDELEAIRKEGPFTQQQIADRLGMTLQGYLSYRKGYSKVSQKNVGKWADALGVPAEQLAKRLGIDLVVRSSPGGLRAELAPLFGPEQGAKLEKLGSSTYLVDTSSPTWYDEFDKSG